MNIYSFPPLIAALITLILGIIVFLRKTKSSLHFSFFLFNLSVFIWLFSYSVTYSINNAKIAFFFTKAACTAVIFTAPTFFHFTINYLKLTKFKKLYIFLYFLLIILSLLFIFTKYFLNEPYLYSWGYYSKAGPLHPYYLVLHFSILSISFFLLIFYRIKNKSKLSSTEKNRLYYAIIAYTIASLSNIDFLQKYGFGFYPFGFIFILISNFILTYTIIKYRLMDIRIILTRAGIFIFVYSLVLFIPIILGITTKLWIISIVLMGILSPIGIFVYSYLRQRIENILFHEQQRYQIAIREMAKRMTSIREVDKIFHEVVNEIYNVIQPQFIGFYIFSNLENSYVLSKDYFPEDYLFDKKISSDSQLIIMLSKIKRPILAENVGFLNFPFETLVVPFFNENQLVGFIVIGQKKNKMMYTNSDFLVFDILSSQVSLALQNAYHLEELRNTQLQLLRQENLKFVSVLVKGLAHEILNPLTPLMHRIDDLETEGLLKIYELYEQNINNLKEEDKIKFKNTILELKETTKSLKENANHIHLIIKTLNDMQKGDSQTMSLIDIKSFFKDVIPLLSIEVDPKIQENVSINQDIEKNLPPIKGNAILLKQVFINLYKNACEAMLNTKNKLIEIIARLDDIDKKNIIIEFKDTGPGMSGEVLSKLFTMGFSTKGKLGSGIGLNQAKAIIEKFGGSINVESKLNEGTKFIIRLPVYQS